MPQMSYQEAYNRVAEVWRDASPVERNRFAQTLLNALHAAGEAEVESVTIAAVLDSAAGCFLTAGELLEAQAEQAVRLPDDYPDPEKTTLTEDPDPGPVVWPRLWRLRAEPDNPERVGGFPRAYVLGDDPPVPIRRNFQPEEVDVLVPGQDDVTIFVTLFQTEIEARAFVQGWRSPFDALQTLISDFDIGPLDIDPDYDPGGHASKTRDGWAACCWMPDARNLVVFTDSRSPCFERTFAAIGPSGPLELRAGDCGLPDEGT